MVSEHVDPPTTMREDDAIAECYIRMQGVLRELTDQLRQINARSAVDLAEIKQILKLTGEPHKAKEREIDRARKLTDGEFTLHGSVELQASPVKKPAEDFSPDKGDYSEVSNPTLYPHVNACGVQGPASLTSVLPVDGRVVRCSEVFDHLLKRVSEEYADSYFAGDKVKIGDVVKMYKQLSMVTIETSLETTEVVILEEVNRLSLYLGAPTEGVGELYHNNIGVVGQMNRSQLNITIDPGGMLVIPIDSGSTPDHLDLAEENGRSKGFGLVQFDTEKSALKALNVFHDTTVEGKEIYVSNFVKKSDRHLVSEEPKFTNLYVKKLEEDVTEDLLQEKCSIHGKVLNVVIMKDTWGNSKGFDFVNFELPEDAKKVAKAMNGTQMGLKKLFVGRAQNRVERDKLLKNARRESILSDFQKNARRRRHYKEMYPSRGGKAYGQQSYSGKSKFSQTETAYSGSSVANTDSGSPFSLASQHSLICGDIQDVDISVFTFHSSNEARYGGQYSSAYVPAFLAISHHILSAKGTGQSSLESRGSFTSAIADSPKFTSSDYLSSSSHAYSRKSDTLYTEKVSDFPSIVRRQYAERQGIYSGRDLQTEPMERFSKSSFSQQHHTDIYDPIDQPTLLRGEQLLKAQSLESSPLDETWRYIMTGLGASNPDHVDDTQMLDVLDREHEDGPNEYEDVEEESSQPDVALKEEKINYTGIEHVVGNEEATTTAEPTSTVQDTMIVESQPSNDDSIPDEKDERLETKKKSPDLKKEDKELMQAFHFFDRNRTGYIRVFFAWNSQQIHGSGICTDVEFVGVNMEVAADKNSLRTRNLRRGVLIWANWELKRKSSKGG